MLRRTQPDWWADDTLPTEVADAIHHVTRPRLAIDQWPEDCGDDAGNVFGDSLRAFHPTIPAHARVLEIGCAEVDWMHVAHRAWPDLVLTGIDARAVHWSHRPEQVHWVRGDVLTHDFPPASFDWILSLTTIASCGLGRYGSHDPDGDTHVLQRACTWLKPGGWLYCDVPLGRLPFAVLRTRPPSRMYDAATMKSRLVGDLPWTVESLRCQPARLSWASHAIDTPPPTTSYKTYALWLKKATHG